MNENNHIPDIWHIEEAKLPSIDDLPQMILLEVLYSSSYDSPVTYHPKMDLKTQKLNIY